MAIAKLGAVSMVEVSESLFRVAKFLSSMAQGEAPAGAVSDRDVTIFLAVMAPGITKTVEELMATIQAADMKDVVAAAEAILGGDNDTARRTDGTSNVRPII